MPYRTARTVRATALALGTAACLMAATAAPAHAEPVDLTAGVTLSNDARFNLVQVSPEGGLYVEDAALGSRGDAYDGAYQIILDDTALGAQDSTGDLRAGGLLIEGPEVGDLETAALYTALPGTSTLRIVVELANGGTTAAKPDLSVFTGLGSDGDTTVLQTSSGDSVADGSDRWVTTDDSGFGGDPIVSAVYSGPGAKFPVSLTQSGDLQTLTGAPTIKPGQVKYLMFFARLDKKAGAAAKAVRVLGKRTPGAGALEGLDPFVVSNMLNWSIPGPR